MRNQYRRRRGYTSTGRTRLQNGQDYTLPRQRSHPARWTTGRQGCLHVGRAGGCTLGRLVIKARDRDGLYGHTAVRSVPLSVLFSCVHRSRNTVLSLTVAAAVDDFPLPISTFRSARRPEQRQQRYYKLTLAAGDDWNSGSRRSLLSSLYFTYCISSLLGHRYRRRRRTDDEQHVFVL